MHCFVGLRTDYGRLKSESAQGHLSNESRRVTLRQYEVTAGQTERGTHFDHLNRNTLRTIPNGTLVTSGRQIKVTDSNWTIHRRFLSIR